MADHVAEDVGRPAVGAASSSSDCSRAVRLARQSEIRVATVAVWVVALFPSSLFLSSVYSEGPLMAFTMGAWLASTIRRPGLAGALALGATLTRPLGVIVLIPLLVAGAGGITGRRGRRPCAPGPSWSPPSAAGLLGYLWWAQRTWGDALMLTQYAGGVPRRDVAGPGRRLPAGGPRGLPCTATRTRRSTPCSRPAPWRPSCALARRGWLAGAAFGAAAVLVPLSSGLTSFSRMVLAAPVLALPLATSFATRLSFRWRRAWFLLWWLTSLGTLAWFSARFATWRWVA